MNIPKIVKIGGQTYSVIRPVVCDEENRNIDGQILYGQGIIKLQEKLIGDYLDYVLVHEVVHGIFEFLSLEQDEKTVDQIARVLHQVIADNPDMFKEGD
jgi:hypothetical protein